MPGFQSVVHQGWHAQKYHRGEGEPSNPYPRDCTAFWEFQKGMSRAFYGHDWREPPKERSGFSHPNAGRYQ